YIGLILGSSLLDYVASVKIHGTSDHRTRKVWLVVSIGANLALLGVFKYYNFGAEAAEDLFGLLGMEFVLPHLKWLLPVGISFYTFEAISYTVDVYRGICSPAKSLLEFWVFITYFPRLVAGPIVRPREFLPQLMSKPSLDVTRASRGLFLIAVGLIKKVAVADILSINLVDRVFASPDFYSATEVVIGLYAFTMQIYCDFSGYTDVARGSAMLMGLELPENFDRPYQSRNPAEFWRRWHMTLSTWLRDYLYFPLGGSRVGPARAYFNLGLTMFLIGLWHGASWTFVFYGLLQATAMVGHRFVHRWRNRNDGDPSEPDTVAVTVFKVFLNLQFVVFSRILFRAEDLANAKHVASRLFSGTYSTAQVSMWMWVLLVGTFALHYVPRGFFRSLEVRFLRLPHAAQGVVFALAMIGLRFVASSEVVPYIYYQF
ncbi:MAG: MBOAT family protein, partial [Myxococcales bacterium]|nr:MBOAT family protein [Myxococcales bacterium]